jgi:hypothetical protein
MLEEEDHHEEEGHEEEEGHDDHLSGNSSDGTTNKVIFLFMCLVVTFLVGILPIQVKKFRVSKHYLGMANSFSAGIFIAIAFVHVIPEVTRSYYLGILEKNKYIVDHDDHRRLVVDAHDEESEHEKIHERVTELLENSFPLPFLIVLVGYGFILWIDKVLFEHQNNADQAIDEMIQLEDKVRAISVN